MSRALAWCLAATLALLAGGCSDPIDSTPAIAKRVHLPPGLAASVGTDEIAVSTVVGIASAQQLTPAAARDLAARDAAFAAAAREAFAGGSIVSVVERGAWARAILKSLEVDAAALGPASDAEVTELTEQRWQDFDRPETVSTTHAVAIVSKPEQDTAAHAIAQHLYDAVRGVTDPQEFIRLAQAVPHEGVEVRAERLPPVTRDGRVYFPDGAPPERANQRFDKDFAEAAHRLSVGAISEPVRSVFGYHVILCEARLPEKRVPLEERRKALTDDVLKTRAERAKQELLRRLSGSTSIAITRSVDDLTARVQVTE